MKLKKEDAVAKLEEMATLLELQGENPFKIRAYQNAARNISNYQEDFDELVASKDFSPIKGVGKGIAKDLLELAETGSFAEYLVLKEKTPATLFDLLKVPGLGPKKVKKLYEELKVQTLGELEYACHENRLVDLDGFGAKTQAKIMQGLLFIKEHQDSYLLAEVMPIAQQLLDTFAKWKMVDAFDMAGSYRRRKEVVRDLDIVCACEPAHSSEVMNLFTSLTDAANILGHGPTKSSIRIKGLQVDLRVVEPMQYPFALHHFTGSKDHHTQLRAHAKKMGLMLNEYGLFKDDQLIPCKSEVEIYSQLGLQYIPPELREGLHEIELAKSQQIPELIERKDVKGVFHVHTQFSDGKDTAEDMVKKAIALGFSYIGFSDHSQTAFYAKGLKEEEIKKQSQELESLRKKYPEIIIFQGIESDILPDGSLDYPQDVLERFDFVIGSVHAKFKMSKEEMTDRCLRALENPFCTMLGHPTARLLLAREGFPIDWDRILESAAKHGKMIELNSNPHRLDIDWRLLDKLKASGVMTSINPDAHSAEGLMDVDFGVYMARKGGLTKSDVFNTKTADEIKSYFKKNR